MNTAIMTLLRARAGPGALKFERGGGGSHTLAPAAGGALLAQGITLVRNGSKVRGCFSVSRVSNPECIRGLR